MLDDKHTIIKLNNIFFKRVQERERDIFLRNAKLAYYCSADTAQSVIEHQELWLRKTSCMNDYKELKIGKEKIVEVFNNKGLMCRLGKILRKGNLDLSADKIKDIAYKQMQMADSHVYIACLTEHTEDENYIGRLSMWRAYGRNAGVAIVMNPNEMDFSARIDEAIFMYAPVLYKKPEDNLNGEFSAFLDRLEADIDFLINFPDPSGLLLRLMVLLIQYTVCSIKHYGFYEEKEWRFLLIFDKGNEIEKPFNRLVKANEVIGGIPQIVYKLGINNRENTGTDIEHLLNRIIIGPTNYPDVIADSLVDALEKHDVWNPRRYIVKSDIPFRAN